MEEEKRKEKEDDTTREKKDIYICKFFLFIKCHFLNLEAQYLIFNLLCTMLELGASFGKYNDFAYDILSNK